MHDKCLILSQLLNKWFVQFFSLGAVDVDGNEKQSCFIVLVRFDGHIKVLTLKGGSVPSR